MNKLKIFHGLVNYGTQAGILSKNLRSQGLKAISLVYSDNYKRKCDLNLDKYNSWIFRQVIRIVLFLKFLCNYNVFHFYYGTSLLPYQLDFPILKLFKKKIVCHYLGLDVQLKGESIEKYKITNVRENTSISENHDQKIKKRLSNEQKYCDLQIVCAPIYLEFVPNAKILPLAIDLNEYSNNGIVNESKNKITILHAPTSRSNKGTQYIESAIDKLLENGFLVEKQIIEKVTHKELLKYYKNCDIFIDQVLAGWHGTASIEAMAFRKPVICYLRSEYIKLAQYSRNIPIVNATPDTLYAKLKELVENKKQRDKLGVKGRDYVERVHDSQKIVGELINDYESLFKH